MSKVVSKMIHPWTVVGWYREIWLWKKIKKRNTNGRNNRISIWYGKSTWIVKDRLYNSKGDEISE